MPCDTADYPATTCLSQANIGKDFQEIGSAGFSGWVRGISGACFVVVPW
jgi:hypothetical protein